MSSCLHCGDCCLRMSPISNPCPHILKKRDFFFCKQYTIRPTQCKNHNFDSRFCPIGLDKLKNKFHNMVEIAQHIDEGQRLAPKGWKEGKNAYL